MEGPYDRSGLCPFNVRCPMAMSVGCRNALNINPNTFLSFFLYLFILFRSDILQICTNYASEFFLNFLYYIGPEN
jgi:hypothetical protein